MKLSMRRAKNTAVTVPVRNSRECTSRLQAILTSEVEKGLDPLRRIAMILNF